MIEIKKLSKSYNGKVILNNVSFNVEEGQILGLIGPNGSGKSTTMKCLCNLVFPDSGEIKIDDEVIDKKNRNNLDKLSSLIESPGLYPNLTAREHLSLFGYFDESKKDETNEVIDVLDLQGFLDKKTSKYSFGMKQRLGIAIALLGNYKYLILDEPFNGLDPNGVFKMRKYLYKLAKEGKGILISSHQLLELEKIGTTNVFIKNGEIVNKETYYKENTTNIFKINIDIKDFSKVDLFKNNNITIINKDKDSGEIVVKAENRENLNEFLKTLTNNYVNIISFNPLVNDIEELYKSIYGE